MKIININGPINSGKSTVSKLLAEQIPNALFIEVDDLLSDEEQETLGLSMDKGWAERTNRLSKMIVKYKKTKQYIPGASKNEFKFVSNDKLYNLKQQVEDYINLLCKDARDGKISLKTLENAKKKNIVGAGLNFVVGFATAAVFLSTIIPKVQYWITRVKTGKNEFPGTYGLEQTETQKVV